MKRDYNTKDGIKCILDALINIRISYECYIPEILISHEEACIKTSKS